MAEIRLAIIGFGKIARDQHLPAMRADRRFKLTAIVAPNRVGDPPADLFTDHREMVAKVALDAVAICTPPGPRHMIARDCLEAGLHVLLEKPPCSTLGELQDLVALSERGHRSLFTAWHAQFNEMVDEAAAVVAREGLRSLRIEWLEDVERWHPGQNWIWQPGGFGVFDAGINGLSIATRLCPAPLLARSCEMVAHGEGGQPIAAAVQFTCAGVAGPIDGRFDWRHRAEERWTIELVTEAGTRIVLADGGSALQIGDGAVRRASNREYPLIYSRFGDLIAEAGSDVDSEPLRLMADIFLKRGDASTAHAPDHQSGYPAAARSNST